MYPINTVNLPSIDVIQELADHIITIRDQPMFPLATVVWINQSSFMKCSIRLVS